MLHMCVCKHSRFVKNHPIWILEDGLLISKVVLSQELPRFDDETSPNTNVEGSKMGGSADGTLEDLTRRLEKLTAENSKLRRKAKGKKTKGGSSSREDEDSSLEEDVSKKGKKGRNNCDKPSSNSMSFNYDNMPSTTAYTSIPIDKAPYFDGTC
jgi:hypothetical protein